MIGTAVIMILICLSAGGYFVLKEVQSQKTEKEGQKQGNKSADKQVKKAADKQEGNNKKDAEETEKGGDKAKEGKEELTEEEKRELEIDEILANMPLEDKVSQLFFVRPEALTGVEVAVQASEVTKAALESYPVGGIVLFSENIENEEQLRTMLSNLDSYSKYPLFLGVDEEGGTLVARVANSGTIQVPTFPDMQEIGNTLQPEKAYEVGETIGGYLKDLGFNLDFAPVADVATNPDNPVIGVRSFGSDADLVAQMVKQEVAGLQGQNISAVLKHFPGHGDTSQDSHEEAAILNKTEEQLKATEFLPFQAGIEGGVDLVMAGHISVPAITGDNTPACLSEKMITGCLRGELGYDGIVITDSMRMGAIVNYYDPGQAAVMVLQAGGDMILMPQDFQKARQAVLDAVNSQTLTEDRLDESLRRIYRKKLLRRQQ